MMPPRYHLGKAVLAGVANGVAFVILPVALLRAIPALLPPEVALPDAILDHFHALEALIVLLGSAAAALAALAAFFARGLAGRAAFGAGRQGGRLAWIHVVLQGGVLALAFEDVALSVDFQRLLLLLYVAILLLAAHFVGEYFAYRKYFRPETYGIQVYGG